MTSSLPSGPVEAPVVLSVGKAIVACNPTPTRFAVYFPPECARPEEPRELGPTYLLLRSKNRWVPMDLEYAPHLVDEIWDAFDRSVDDAYQDYMEEIYADRGEVW